jgi:hypothetical protein
MKRTALHTYMGRSVTTSLAALACAGGLILITACGGNHSEAAASGQYSSAVVAPTPSHSAAGPKPSASASAHASKSSAASGAKSSAKPGATKAAPKSSAASAPQEVSTNTPSTLACTITSSDEVVKAFGGRVSKASTTTTGTGFSVCKFTVAGSKVGPMVTVSVSSHKPLDQGTFNAGKKLAVKTGAVSVNGVGDGAYYNSSAGTLQFIQGNVGGFVEGSLPVNPSGQSSSAAMESSTVNLAKSIIADL